MLTKTNYKHMKKSVLILGMVFLSILGVAKANNTNKETKKKAYKIYGKVIESSTGEAVEFANIVLMNAGDSSLVGGTISSEDGSFELVTMPQGSYILTANFIGYQKEFISDIRVTRSNNHVDVGVIQLKRAVESIESVKVVGEKSYLSYKPDKKVINVSQHMNAAGGTAIDVLENIPSVSVDAEGKASLRGSQSFTVLIDGRPSPMSGSDILQQLPASSIESIEIITNPSAKYDPDGVAGIINLVLKKNKKSGFNGMINTTAGTGGKYAGDIQMNYRIKKLNVFGGIDYNNRSYYMENDMERTTFGVDTNNILISKMKQDMQNKSLMGNLGLDYSLSDRDAISWSLRASDMNFGRDFTSKYHQLDQPYSYDSYSLNKNDFGIDGGYLTSNLNHQHKFNTSGHELSTNFFYALWSGRQNSDQASYLTNNNWEQFSIDPDLMRNLEETRRTEYRVKSDYILPLNEKSKVEAGVQGRFEMEEDDYLMENYNNSSGSWEVNSLFTNDLDYSRSILSVYTTYSGVLKGFNYHLGIRGEYTDRLVHLKTNDEKYTIDRFDYFPSAHISKQLPKNQQLQISYSRRINRPGRFHLNPSPMFSDDYSLQYGNPDLNPEYIDSYELNYHNRINASFLAIEFYFRKTKHGIERIFENTGDDLLGITFDNVSQKENLGLEVMGNVAVNKWLRLNASSNIFQNSIEGAIDGESVDQSNLNWNARFNGSIKVFPLTRLQITAFYNGPTTMSQGEIEPYFFASLAVRQELFKRRATLVLQMRDPLGMMKMNMKTHTEAFALDTEITPEAQTLTLTLSYKINNYQRRTKQEEQLEMNFDNATF